MIIINPLTTIGPVSGFCFISEEWYIQPKHYPMKDASNLNIGEIRRQSILANFENTTIELIEVPISKSLFDELSNDIEKAKYLKRLGSPGNYTYIYAEPKGKSKKKEGEKESLMKPHAGKTYEVAKRGKGELAEYVLEATDGSHQVNMTFSDEGEAKKFAEKRGFPMGGDSEKPTTQHREQLSRVLSALKVAHNDYKDASKITVEATPKGNWKVYYEGKDTGITYDGKLLSEGAIRSLNLEHHG